MTSVMIGPKAHKPARFSYGNNLTIVKETLEILNSSGPRM